VKSWIVIPATGVVSAAAAVAISRDPFTIAASGLAGAAVADAARALHIAAAMSERGATSARADGPATLVAAILAPLLVIASFAEHAAIAIHHCLAIAAIAWTIALLAKHESPLVALLPALVACVLEPAGVVLVPIVGTRLVRTDAQRAVNITVPLAGGLGIMLAAFAGSAHHGMFATLGAHWFGPAHPIAVRALPALVADAVGPLTAVAALAGLAQVAKLRLAELAVVAVAAGALFCDLRAGTVSPTTLAIAALLAALAIGRFARTIRLPSIQGIAGAIAAAILLVPPAWIAVEQMR
jgi:hypothetical protein